jgi:DNA alkylation repair enzyme
MPAVELSRLRAQINGLIERFADPASFRIALRDLLDLYANRAYRAGQAVQPQPLLPSYRITPLIMQQLELELSKTCQERPEQALEIVETLWHDPYLEPRLLAATLLGAIPPSQGEAVIQKLRAWALPAENFRMLNALFNKSTTSLRRSAPHLLFSLFEEWLASSESSTQAIGVRALIPMVEDNTFENLPPVFRLLSPLVQSTPTALQIDLQAALEALSRRTPIETAYFLRQALSMAPGQGTARLVRRCLPLFDPEQQASLRAALHASSSS